MKQKSDVHAIIPKFCSMIQTQFTKSIKQFRSDNAHELVFKDFFSRQGILHQFSCVESPQQNSAVERKHQHLLNVARALFFQSQVPIKFWSECGLTATFLINRTPTPLLSHKSPFECLYGHKPDYDSMRVFGSLVYASTLKSHRTKFEPRAKKCVFLGYPQGIKGYRLYDLEKQELFTSRDVIFHEQIFPFHNKSICTSTPDPFPNLSLPLSQPLSSPHFIDDEPFHTTTLTTDNSHETTDFPQTQITSIDNLPEHVPDIIPTSITPPTSNKRSKRPSHPPNYLKDFHCNIATADPIITSPHNLAKYMSYTNLSQSHKAFALAVSIESEPQFYHQAVKHDHWRLAMDDEIKAMHENGTWSVVRLPSDKQSIGCRWVFRNKFNSDGSLARHKARLVAKGYN